MEQRKKIYETTFIANATLDDAQIDQIVERFKDFLGKNGAEVRTLDKWGRKRLAYPIEKKNNGFYTVCEFTAPSDIMTKLERYYALDENIMRFLTVQLTEKMLKARQEQERKMAAEAAAAAAPPVTAPAPAPVPVAAARPEPKVAPPGSQNGDEDEDDVT
jgi:small subunit ribosomal protein S6